VALQLTPMTGCVTPPGALPWFSHPNLAASGTSLAYTNETTWAPYYEYWPTIVVYSLTLAAASNTPASASAPDLAGWFRLPALSPDGQTVALVHWDVRPELLGIWLYRDRHPADEAYVQLTADPDAIDVDRIAWAPDGTFLVYSRDGWLYRVSTSVPGETPLGVQGICPSVSPSGRIVYAHEDDLWIHENGVSTRLMQTPAVEGAPSWFLDGRWIVYESNAALNWDIWAVTPGGEPVQITTDPADDRAPSMNGDGSRLVFQSYRACPYPNIWMATDLPDWTVAVQSIEWTQVKRLYR